MQASPVIAAAAGDIGGGSAKREEKSEAIVAPVPAPLPRWKSIRVHVKHRSILDDRQGPGDRQKDACAGR